MNILLYFETQKSLRSQNLGGIEILNLDLYKMIKQVNSNTFLTNNLSHKIKKIKWDVVISSNDAKIFDRIQTKKKILWLHNLLQLEKAFRKKQLVPIMRNKITAVFNSNYLKKNTNILYNFDNKIVIPNFLTSHFQNLKLNLHRNPYFVWSVQRTKGLEEIVDIWIKQINPVNSKAKFFIFGLNNSKIGIYNLQKLKKYNIFFMGRVNRQTLRKFYLSSMGMICLGYDETFCLNAIESMACGLPIITFGYTALSEISGKQNSFKALDFDDVSQKILLINNMNSKSRNRLIKNCVQFSKKYYLNNFINIWFKTIGINNYIY